MFKAPGLEIFITRLFLRPIQLKCSDTQISSWLSLIFPLPLIIIPLLRLRLKGTYTSGP